MSWVGILLTFSLAENVVFARLLGLYPCAELPVDRRKTVGVGLALIALVTAGAMVAWALRVLVLEPAGLGWLLPAAAGLAIAAIAGLARIGLRLAPAPAIRMLGPAIQPVGALATALGVALAISRERFGAIESLVAGVASGLGFLLAQLVLGAIAERMQTEDAPKFLRGTPLALLSAGLVALAFAGLDRALIARLAGQ